MIKGHVAIQAEGCKGCAFCVEFRPTRVLAFAPTFNAKGYHPPHVVAADKCNGCYRGASGGEVSGPGGARESGAGRSRVRHYWFVKVLCVSSTIGIMNDRIE